MHNISKSKVLRVSIRVNSDLAHNSEDSDDYSHVLLLTETFNDDWNEEKLAYRKELLYCLVLRDG